MRVLCSDLLTSLSPAPIFDWIIFNPPFFPREATHALEAALNAGKNYDVIARFLKQAADFLSPEGRLLLILSSDMNLQEINRLIEQAKFKIVRCDVKPHIFEVFYLLQLKPLA
jgi:release factor glutamine methyltransferase